MAFGAVLFEEISSGGDSVGIPFQRIALGARFLRGFGQLGVDQRVLVVLVCRRPLPLRESDGYAEENSGGGERSKICPHRWPSNKRLTIEPNPAISRETPQRKRKRWLLSFKPKPAESRRVQSEGRFQAATGAK